MAGSGRKGYLGLHSPRTPSYTKTKGQCGREEKWLLSLQLVQNKRGASLQVDLIPAKPSCYGRGKNKSTMLSVSPKKPA